MWRFQYWLPGMHFRKNLKSNLFLLGICLIIIGFGFLQKKTSYIKIINTPTPSPVEIAQSETAKVIKVFDGDTIEIEGGIKVRYIGVDSTEVYPSKQCFSAEAKAENEKLVLGKEVTLIKDISETDKYGRLLRYVFVGDEFINDDLVKNGFAKVMTVPPDENYKDEFEASENYAKENNLGLWSKCF